MRRRWNVCISALAALVLCASTLATAQRGQGRPPGAGPGQHGAPATTGRPTTPPGGSGAPSSAKGSGPATRTSAPSASEKKTPSELLAQNTKLSSRLEPLLPAGTNLQDAASGFRNLGQFVAAVHVSKNLGIPFDQLKVKMTTGANLGEVIHELKPDVDAKAEARKAEKLAKRDLRDSRS